MMKLHDAILANRAELGRLLTLELGKPLAIGMLAEQVAFPPGVLNIVTGSAAKIAAEMRENPLLRKITFTDSTADGIDDYTTLTYACIGGLGCTLAQ